MENRSRIMNEEEILWKRNSSQLHWKFFSVLIHMKIFAFTKPLTAIAFFFFTIIVLTIWPISCKLNFSLVHLIYLTFNYGIVYLFIVLPSIVLCPLEKIKHKHHPGLPGKCNLEPPLMSGNIDIWAFINFLICIYMWIFSN